MQRPPPVTSRVLPFFFVFVFYCHILLNYAAAMGRDTCEKVEVGPVWAGGGIR